MTYNQKNVHIINEYVNKFHKFNTPMKPATR